MDAIALSAAHPRWSRSGRLLLSGALILFALAVALAAPAAAEAVTCPNPVPVVDENNCQGAGSTAWRLTNYSNAGVAGFATKPSVNRGQDVVLKVGRFGSSFGTSVDIFVYRMGYYGGTGGRLVHTRLAAAVTNSFNCAGPDAQTGLVDCSGWDPTYTIPGSALPASGIYLVRIRATDNGTDSHIPFVVRDDARAPESKLLYKLPNATYQAYNNWGGKSLYTFNSTGGNTVSGTSRAVKVSYSRPIADPLVGDNWFLKADYPLVYWLERQGFDTSYTEDVQTSLAPGELRDHDALVLSGHDEYWSGEQMTGYKAARDAGVGLASFSANTAYWKVRYEDGGQTMVSYKTVQGSGSSGSGAVTPNDPGPDGAAGTADDAIGADGVAGTADDRPQNATTTFRDNGAPPGDPNAPAAGRVGPDEPENSLFGSMYVGDNDNYYYPLQVPAGNGANEYAADRVWRNTGLPAGSDTTFGGSKLIGWEWDAVPTQAQYLSRQPVGVKRLSSSATTALNPGWLQDEGRVYAPTPPPGQPGVAQAVKYTAPSGALVFAGGTNQWSWGLGPHWNDNPSGGTYQDPPVDSSDARIQQATYNVISDMGVQPDTPTGIVVDSGGNQPPSASFSVSPSPAQVGQTVTFDGSGSTDPGGSIARYQWDLDGNGSFETDTGSTSTTTRSYPAAGTLTLRLRVTDGGGLTDETSRTLVVGTPPTSAYAQAVLGTTGVKHYWRMGEASGATLADAKGGRDATVSGATLGVAGALAGDTDKAVSFDGVNDSAFAPVDLFSANRVSVEFWLKWDAYANDDDLAMEFTSNFNSVPGGFLVDPNAPQESGRFGVGIGSGASRNNVFFVRPSAGAWHHYVLVFDTSAPAAQQIVPYVDGQPVAYTKTASGTGAGNFANSTLNFMSRNGTALFGAGDLDEVAVYDTALSAATVRGHFETGSGGQVANQPPTAAFTVSPSPAQTGQTVSFNGSGSADPDGSIAKYEWDLDGNGSFESDTGTVASTSRSYASSGTLTVQLRVTDNRGDTAQTSRTLVIGTPPTSAYAQAILGTAGVKHYWRMGEGAGSTLVDAKGGRDATVSGATLGAAGALAGDADTAVSFDGTNDSASAPVDLSATSRVTVEFWLKWTGYAGDDDLAMEFTSNFNSVPGGFLADPNDSVSGRFAFGIGRGGSRNNVLFTRPSAGAWHHYAFVLDTTAPAAQQILPYVDGQPVSYTKSASGTGAGTFANSTLNVMSRNGSALFGAGSLDELALYDAALNAATVRAHYETGTATPLPNQTPTASFSAMPSTPQAGATVAFDGSASADPDGTIAKYEWDLDGNGSYETDTGTTATTSRSYGVAGPVVVRLRVTDDRNATATTSRTLTVGGSSSGAYPQAVLGTSGIKHYWRMEEGAGTTLVDTKGDRNATVSGATLGVPGALAGSTDTAARFDGVNDSAFAALDLSSTTRLTVEFWLKWTGYAPDDDLAMEFTSNFNNVAGGFLVDPNDSGSGRFAFGIGRGGSRNNVLFTRPSAGAWHHYAFVVDTGAPAAAAIVPYVDGRPVTYTKSASGTGAGAFANSTLNFMSRNGSALFGAGDLDELAIYDAALGAATVRDHYDTGSGNREPSSTFTVAPTPARIGQDVAFDGAGSSDPDGPIAKYEWDLDGNGSFETDTQTTARATRAYSSAGEVSVRLRVTDGAGATDTTTRTLVVDSPPRAALAAPAPPVLTGRTTAFDGAGSADPDGSIAKYEWDLDGNGSFETDTGTTATATRTYSAAERVTVSLRVTDAAGTTDTAQRTVQVADGASGPYSQAVLDTPGLRHYWRMGEGTGTTLGDSAGTSHATRTGATLGAAGALDGDANTAVRFDGTGDSAAAAVDLSASGRLTVEFWLRWDAFSGNDDLAMEFTPNFNNVSGGFLVDPNDSAAPSFAFAIGRSGSRNNVIIQRPSAGAWHHYAFTIDTAAPAATTILPYVDGQPVTFTKTASGTGAGTFADSTLHFMSRGTASLFGAGTLDEVALYATTLTAATVLAHHDSGT